MLLFKKINLRLYDFAALNRTLFIIAWFYGAILDYYNPQSWRMLFDVIYLLIPLYILYTKISHFFARRSFINFLLNSPLNLVIGALGTGKTALMVLASYLLSGWKTISTFPITDKQMLSLGHMSLLDYNYPILEEKHLLLWDETNLFLEGIDYKENDRVTQGLQEYFASAWQFTHIVLASGQRAEHIWVKVRDIANSIIIGIRKKLVSIFRPYLQVIYGTFKSVNEYEQWRLTLINAKNDKKGRKIKYRSIPELDIYFFKLKIPMSILNLYDNKYLSFLRELSNRALNDNYQHKFWNDNVMDIEALEYLKMGNLAKMADFLAQMLYKVFDLIWTLTIPETDIRVIIFPLIMLVINLVIGGILGIHIERPKVGFRKKYRKSVANWGTKKQSSSGSIKKFSGKNPKNRPWINQHGRRIKR